MFETGLAKGNKQIQEAAADRKDLFLSSQAILPRSVDDEKATGDREIVIDLDTKNDRIDIRLGDELTSDNRDKFFAFKSKSANSKKIYFATNNFYYHLRSIDEMISYIQDNLDDRYPEFAKYLVDLRERFYKEDENQNWFLNPDKLTDIYREKFYEYSDDKDDLKNTKSAFTELVSKEVLASTRKSFAKSINVCTLKIDGIRAHEKNFPYQKEYVDIIYYERQGRFFDTSEPMVQENAACSGCQQQKKVTGKIDIPTKFYITDKPTFFEKLNGKKAYKSFALCEECYQELMIGIDHIQNDYSGNLFGTYYYLVPRTFNIQNLDEKMLFIKETLLKDPKNLVEEFEKHRDLVKSMKRENLRFDFLFYWTSQASFIVAEYVSDVEYKKIDNILQTIQSFQSGYYSARDQLTAGMKHIYWLLFPNKGSHSNPDSDRYRKELLHIFKALLKNGVLLYRNLLNKFLSIYGKTKYRKQSEDVSFAMRPLQMHMLLSLFYEHSNLQGLNSMNSQKSYTGIINKEVEDFFETHPEIYKENKNRQGLVLLGVLMNQILKEQNKQGKSSTIMEKLNFDGMPVQRLSRFVDEISKYLSMRTYKLYQKNSVLHAAMLDRLHNIENNDISKDEVVFYILTGISLSSYIGYKHNQEKEKAGVTNE